MAPWQGIYEDVKRAADEYGPWMDFTRIGFMRAYFLGIAGAGMSALASVLKSDGAEVSGSDDGVFPPVSTYLERQGLGYHDGFDAALVPPDVDVAIVGTSAKLELASNPELQELVRRGAPRFSFAEYLGRHT